MFLFVYHIILERTCFYAWKRLCLRLCVHMYEAWVCVHVGLEDRALVPCVFVTLGQSVRMCAHTPLPHAARSSGSSSAGAFTLASAIRYLSSLFLKADETAAKAAAAFVSTAASGACA